MTTTRPPNVGEHRTPAPNRGTRTRLLAVIGTALAGLVVTLLPVTPATAAGPASPAAPTSPAGDTEEFFTVTGRNLAVYPGQCGKTQVRLAAHGDASGTGTWSGRWAAELVVKDRYGFEVAYASYDTADASRTKRFRLCERTDFGGTYRARVYWEQYDDAGDVIASDTTIDRFRFRIKPRARTTLKVDKQAYGSTGWKFTGTLKRLRKPHKWQKVSLWIRYNGSWVNYDATKTTNRRGKVSWHTRPDLKPNRFLFQLRYKGNKTSKPARSDNFRLSGR